MFVKKVSLGILVGLLAVSCGRSGSSSRDLKEGYYAYNGDTSTVSYPLVIVRYEGDGTSIYQLSQIDSGGFGSGLRSSVSSSDLWTTIVSRTNNGPMHEGVITQKGDSLRVRTLEITSDTSIRQESDLSKVNILEDNVLDPITKDAAIALMKSLVTAQGGGNYSDEAEADCQGAFEMSCTELFE